MKCPNCGLELEEESLYCAKCGQDIHIVPDYDLATELTINDELTKVAIAVDENLKQEKLKEENQRRDKRLHIGLSGLVLILVFLFLGFLGVYYYVDYYNHSASRCIAKAEEYLEEGYYSQAVEWYEKAYAIEPSQTHCLIRLSELYYLQNLEEQYESVLQVLLREELTKEQHLEVCNKIITVWKRTGNYAKINELLLTENSAILNDRYCEFLAAQPVLELACGRYEQMQSLRITAEGNGTIYYTTDGSIPTERSEKYKVPIVLDYGINTIKACVINDYNIKGTVVTGEYEIIRPQENE